MALKKRPGGGGKGGILVVEEATGEPQSNEAYPPPKFLILEVALKKSPGVEGPGLKGKGGMVVEEATGEAQSNEAYPPPKFLILEVALNHCRDNGITRKRPGGVGKGGILVVEEAAGEAHPTLENLQN